jgi:tetrathionate reductase subunit B
MSVDQARRKFLWEAAALTGIALAPGITLYDLAHGRAPEAAAPGSVRWGLLVDMNRCQTDCDACVRACDTENGLSGGKAITDSQWIRKVTLKDMRGNVRSLPMMCQHCAEPPCVDVCPTGASFKRADGIVLVDRHTCIGCRYCMMACPYGARSFVHEPISGQKPEVPRGKGCVESCTLCVHRVDHDRIPACVEACASEGHRALLFGDLNDPKSEIAQRIASVAMAQVRADLRLDTAVRYQGL